MPNTIPSAGEAMPVEVQSPKMRIDALLEEAVKIIRDNPDLMIDHTTANKHGIYTTLTIPRAEEHPWTKARRLMKELSATLDDCDDATCGLPTSCPRDRKNSTPSVPIPWDSSRMNCRSITSNAFRGNFPRR